MAALAVIALTSFVIALSGAMMPGPLLTATISESSRRGPVTGPLLILGHGLLELVLVAGLVLGLGPFLEREAVFVAVGFAGGGLLVWMGARMLRSVPGMRLCWEAEGAAHGHLVITGALLSLANPYWTVWWATLGVGYIAFSMKAGYAGLVAFFAGHILADFAWYAAVSLAVGKGRRLLTDRVYRGVLAVCAVFLVGFGAYFVVAAAGRALG